MLKHVTMSVASDDQDSDQTTRILESTLTLIAAMEHEAYNLVRRGQSRRANMLFMAVALLQQ